MTEQSREFSICLLPTEGVVNNVQALRQELPGSPYRDDMPHITLLRGISSAEQTFDEVLIHHVSSLVNPSDHLPLQATVRQVANKDNQFYSSSGLIILDASKELLAYRANVATVLRENNYTIEPQELGEYTPHITIRLGVPLEGRNKERAQDLFENRLITFSQWLIFRLVFIDGKRTMHEVRPSLGICS